MASQIEADEIAGAVVASVMATGFGDYEGAEAAMSGVDVLGALSCLRAWTWLLLARSYGSPEHAALALSQWMPGDALPPSDPGDVVPPATAV